MAQLLVRDLPEAVVRSLKSAAAKHGRSAEAEHRRILEERSSPDGTARHAEGVAPRDARGWARTPTSPGRAAHRGPARQTCEVSSSTRTSSRRLRKGAPRGRSGTSSRDGSTRHRHGRPFPERTLVVGGDPAAGNRERSAAATRSPPQALDRWLSRGFRRPASKTGILAGRPSPVVPRKWGRDVNVPKPRITASSTPLMAATAKRPRPRPRDATTCKDVAIDVSAEDR